MVLYGWSLVGKGLGNEPTESKTMQVAVNGIDFDDRNGVNHLIVAIRGKNWQNTAFAMIQD